MSVLVILAGFLGDGSAADAIETDFPPERPFCVHPFWVEVGDWNRDGRDDVLAVANRRDVLEIGTAVGDDEGGLAACNLFRQEMPLEIAFYPDGAVFADFDKDGALDVAVTDGSGNPPVLGEWGPSRVLVFLADGDVFEVREAVSFVDRRSGHFHLATGDLDGDGNLDLILGTARTSEGFIDIRLGDGHGSFEAAGEISLWSPSEILVPEDFELGDLDGDGRQDLVVLLTGPLMREIRVFLNSGRGGEILGFERRWQTRVQGTSFRVQITGAALNDAAHTDLVVVSGGELEGEQQILRYVGLGDGTFEAPPMTYPVVFPLSGSVVADFDEDGDNDLLVHGEVVFQVLLSSQDHVVSTGNLYSFRSPSASHTRFATGDIDGDGHLDLVLPNSDSAREPAIVIVPGRGDGTFGTRNAGEGTCGQYGRAAFGDLDEDGIDDIVGFKNHAPDPIRTSLGPCVLLGTGNADGVVFTPGESYGDSAAVHEVHVADFDNDGHRDVLHGVGSGIGGGFAFWHGNGDGTLRPPIFFDHPIEPGRALPIHGVADFNKDGNLDFVASGVFVFLGHGDGTFSVSWSTLEDSQFADRCCLGYTSGLGYVSVPTDIDGDGHLDFVVADGWQSGPPDWETAIWGVYGNGDGTFRPEVVIEPEELPGGRAGGSVVRDFNNDGVNDLAVTHFGSTGSSCCAADQREVRIFLGEEPGAFRPDFDIVPSGGEMIVSEDLDRDGNYDLVLAHAEERLGEGNRPSTLLVLYGLGNGHFAEPVSIATRLFHDVKLRDMNADGLLDFVFVGGGFLGDGIEVVFQDPPVGGFFLRGDCNGDLRFDVSDALAALGYLFLGDAAPGCIESCNADAGAPGSVDIGDPVLMLVTLFGGGTAKLPRCEANTFRELCRESRCSDM